MLPAEEIKRRVEAARILRGLSQKQLAELVHADGLGKHDVGRLERGDLPLTRALRDALIRHLRVPDRWFSDPDVDVIVGIAEPTEQDLSPASLRDLLEQALARVDQVADQAPQETRKGPAGTDRRRRSAGGGDA